MNRIFQFIIFFSIFVSIYGLMNYYVYSRLSKIIDYKYLWIIILVLALSFPVISILERTIDGTFISALYYLAMTWLGAVFFMLVAFALLDLVALFVKLKYKEVGLIVLLIVSFIVVYSLINAQNTRITKIEVPLKNLNKTNDGLKIVQLSDVHVGTIHKKKFLTNLVDKTNSLKPDIVVITGDLFDGSGPMKQDMLDPLKNLNAPTYFATGNHENYHGKEEAIKIIKSNNIVVLENEFVKIKGVQLIGLDNPSNDFDRDSNKVLNLGLNLTDKSPKILLHHIPTIQNGIDLQLSGHTHNGQIFPFTLLVRVFFSDIYGLYKHNESYIYVSSGVGTWGPPMRFLAPSEIVEITLRKAK